MNRSQNQLDKSFEIEPLVGTGCIHLGDSEDEVRRELTATAITFNDSLDPFCWQLEEPRCALTFENGIKKRLVQIDFSNELGRVQGQPLIGVMLDEALLHLGVRSAEDTLWSIVDIDSEYTNGLAIADAKRPTRCDVNTLMDGGTLWIKSLGLGLSVRIGVVESIAMRRAQDVPRVGCGPLDSRSMTAVADPELSQKVLSSRDSARKSASRKRGPTLARRIFFSCLAIAFVIAPIYFVVDGWRSWSQATEVQGRVVSTRPDGPFPDEIIVRYEIPDGSPKEVSIPYSYTTAREVGDVVDLLYLPRDPSRAMTSIQARDQSWAISPYLLFGSIAAATFSLRWAFPEYIRLRSKKPLND